MLRFAGLGAAIRNRFTYSRLAPPACPKPFSLRMAGQANVMCAWLTWPAKACPGFAVQSMLFGSYWAGLASPEHSDFRWAAVGRGIQHTVTHAWLIKRA